jgi:hypothetical protein
MRVRATAGWLRRAWARPSSRGRGDTITRRLASPSAPRSSHARAPHRSSRVRSQEGEGCGDVQRSRLTCDGKRAAGVLIDPPSSRNTVPKLRSPFRERREIPTPTGKVSVERPRRKPTQRPPPPRQTASEPANSSFCGFFELSRQNLLLPAHGSVASTPRRRNGPFGGDEVGDKESVREGLRRPPATKGAGVSEPRTPTAAHPGLQPKDVRSLPKKAETNCLTREPGWTRNPAPPTGSPTGANAGKQRSLKTG